MARLRSLRSIILVERGELERASNEAAKAVSFNEGNDTPGPYQWLISKLEAAEDAQLRAALVASADAVATFAAEPQASPDATAALPRVLYRPSCIHLRVLQSVSAHPEPTFWAPSIIPTH